MVPILALVVVLGFMYLTYGLPFVIVVRDTSFTDGLKATVSHALDSSLYAAFGLAHLVGGVVASVALTLLVRNGGFFGIVIGTLAVAVPAVFIGVYGLLVFRDITPIETGAARS